MSKSACGEAVPSKEDKPRPGPLAGIRVVDTTSVLFGPYCTQLLGDMGADVIKVESFAGDNIRNVGFSRSPGMSGVFLSANRNKRSIAVDMKRAEGLQIVLDLVSRADVFVTNIRRKAVARLGLDYDRLSARDPRLIYCSAVGFGEGGPYEDYPAFDDTIQAISGMASLQAQFSGEPSYVAMAAADKITGITLALAIVAAIRHRDRTGEGQRVEVPMFETMVSFNLLEHLFGHTFDPPLGPTIYPRVVSKNRRPYRTADGYLAVLPYSDEHWSRFFLLVGRPECIRDCRFATIAERTRNINDLYALLADEMAKHTTQWWLKALSEKDIPAVPVKSPADLLDDVHLNARDFFQKVEHPTEGRIVSMMSPIQMSRSPMASVRLAPRLGQHTVEVLRELGYQQPQIDSLRAMDIVRNS